MAFTFDTKAQVNSSTDNPVTLAFTCGANAKLLVIGIATKQTSGRGAGTPTYNSVSMAQAGTKAEGLYEASAEIWYLVNPDTGSEYTISVPNPNGDYVTVIASSYVSSGTPELDATNQTPNDSVMANPSLAVTPTEDGAVIADILCSGLSTESTANTHTLLYKTDEGGWNTNAQYALQESAGEITLGYTMDEDDVAMIVAAFKETGGVTPKTSSDSGSGADAKASNHPMASLTKGEAGSGADTLTSFLAAIAKSESGSGADTTLSFLASLKGVDGGSGTDSLLALLVAVLASETGGGIEQSLLSLLLSSSESGSGSEAVVSLLAELLKGDSGSGVEYISGRDLILPDSGAGVDSFLSLLAAILGLETGSGVEQSSLSIIVARFSSETGSGVEVANLIELLVSGDVGVGSDLSLVLKDICSYDWGSGFDALKALVGTAGAGSGMRLHGRSGQAKMPSRRAGMPSKGVNI